MTIQRTSTSVPASTPQWEYDVFLSFRGEDTRKGFTDNLYTALDYEGIITFRDDPDVKKGEALAPALSAAIEKSRFAVIVLSPNYASSTWCLNELVHILECMKTNLVDASSNGRVLPIFYDVNPSDVRKQIGSCGEAFTKHEERFFEDNEKVQRWRSALTEVANFSGRTSQECRYERELIRDIVEDILQKVQPASFSNAKNLVGMESRLQPVFLHLGLGADDVRFIGIWGMGGIGKTTLVTEVYERISREFECSYLLTNVRDSADKGGLLNLQKQLLSGTMGTEKAYNILNSHEAATALKRLLGRKRVLLILDDVNKLDQLEYLARNRDWFGSGSRVLITTRDEHLLIQHDVQRRVKVEELNRVHSLKLFSKKAFKEDYPVEGFHDLSAFVVSYANGLPLALEVLGSFLYGRDLSEWKSALSQLRKVCSKDIFDVLKISYNDLNSDWQRIFLDIACFFNGHERDRVTEVLNSCDVAATIGIKVLMERSLVTLSDGRLWMHDLLREMGQEQSHIELGRPSRLWLFKDVTHVLTTNTGTEAVEGIIVHSTESKLKVDVTPKSFSMMHKLRYLKIGNVNLPKGLEYLPNSLRILNWTRYPLKSLPAHFSSRQLFELTLCHSCLKHVQIGTGPLYNLKSINLSHSVNLVNTPNLKDMPYLEILCLEGCTSLYEVDPGIEVLERLTALNLKDCKNLVHFASSVRRLKSLKVLDISGCSKLDKLPEDLGHTECLVEVDASKTSIRELPCSIGLLKELVSMSLRDCKHLLCLPSSIGGLKSLKYLYLSDCSKLDKLPDELGQICCLEKLDVSRSGIIEVPSIAFLKNLKELSLAGINAHSVRPWNMMINPLQLLRKQSHIPAGLSLSYLSSLPSLTCLNLSDCNLSDEAMPSDFGCLASLKQLILSNNQFVRLPESIGQLSRLEYLNLDGCSKLQIVPMLSADAMVRATNCTSLDIMVNQIGQRSLLPIRHLASKACDNKNPTMFIGPGNEIPEWYNHRGEGSSITLKLHPGWFTNTFMGFALCVVFGQLKPLPPLDEWYISWSITANGLSVGNCYPIFGGKVGQPVGDHIWFLYVSRNYSKGDLQDFQCQLTFKFEPDPYEKISNLEIIRMKKCGVRVVYEKDVEELRQTLLKQSNNTKRGLQLLCDDVESNSIAGQAHP